MNFLAHIFLAQYSQAAMLGGILGDFVPVRHSFDFPDEMNLEIKIHRLIDSYTDRHPAVLAAKSVFPADSRRYAGILLDIYFDFLLSAHWNKFSPQPRASLITSFYQGITQYQNILPPRLRDISDHMVAHDWLGGYAHWDGVSWAVQRTARRLSRNGDALIAGLPVLREAHDYLDQQFLLFFPQLQQYTEISRAEIRQHRPGLI
ncbi:MAG: ACP phosphodiesterase [Undibacterium curvum]|uniref:acyl carrier protein phosphodiesterase n=1 Tax=Undibacterium curvum TaxID=2762294 RepID=UPI003BEC4BFE